MTFTKSLTAGVLALSLTFTSLTPAPAMASQNQFSEQDALLGLLTLFLVGAAIHHSNKDDAPAPPPAPAPDPFEDPFDDPFEEPFEEPFAHWREMPLECLRHATRRNGNQITYYGQRCMERNYDFADTLPEVCHVRFRRNDGRRRQGYRRTCLQDHGFRVNQH